MKWLREPLVQFLLIGAALFGLFAIWGGPNPAPAGQYRIIITPGMVQNLAVSYQRSEKRAPTDQELTKLINNYIEEEILNREARTLGLDQDDPLIRSQLRQKMEYYLEDSAAIAPPTEAQLEAFLQKNAASFRKPNGALPLLKDSHDAVLAAWMVDQRRQTAAAAYEKLRARYQVEVQMPVASTPMAATSSTTDRK
jgi:hypothetical protein